MNAWGSDARSRLIVYIAGPITGIPEKNLPAFEKAEQDLVDAGYAVLNPRTLEATAPPDATYQWFLRKALGMLLMADVVALLDGWEESNGARLEQYVALTCGMPCLPIRAWLVPR